MTTKSGALTGARSVASPASAMIRVMPMKITMARTTKNEETQSGVPMIHSHRIMTAVPPRAPMTAPR